MTSGDACDVVHYGQTSDKKMKNTRIIEMYGEMLRQLKSRLDQADGIFMEMSQKIVGGMAGDRFSEANRDELQTLDRKYCAILADVLEGLSAVYHGRIQMFPVPDHAGLIEKMEKRNAQAEELERIVDDLMEEAGLGDRKNNRQSNNIWRSMMADMDFRSEFERKFEEAASFSKRPNILVAGYTGCGKTSLIRTILGGDIVPKSGIDNGKPCRIDFDSYENDSIRLWDSRGLELGDMEEDFREKMREFVSDCQDDVNVDEHIHLVWYLIQGNGARVTDCDLALMKEIFTFDDVIAVISKKDITKPEQSAAIRKELIDAGVPEHRIIEVSDAESGAVGCRELVNLSCKMLPDAYRDAFMAAQSIDREAKAAKVAEKKDRAKEIIAKAVAQAKSGENGFRCGGNGPFPTQLHKEFIVADIPEDAPHGTEIVATRRLLLRFKEVLKGLVHRDTLIFHLSATDADIVEIQQRRDVFFVRFGSVKILFCGFLQATLIIQKRAHIVGHERKVLPDALMRSGCQIPPSELFKSQFVCPTRLQGFVLGKRIKRILRSVGNPYVEKPYRHRA